MRPAGGSPGAGRTLRDPVGLGLLALGLSPSPYGAGVPSQHCAPERQLWYSLRLCLHVGRLWHPVSTCAHASPGLSPALPVLQLTCSGPRVSYATPRIYRHRIPAGLRTQL